MPINETDERYKISEELSDLIHSAANLCRTAIMSDDDTVKKALKTSASTLLKMAIKKIEEVDVSDEDDE